MGDLLYRLPVWLLACAGLLAFEADRYWRTTRAWAPESRIFAFALGVASVLACATGWAVAVPDRAFSVREVLALVFAFFAAGGLGTGVVFGARTWEDSVPGRWLRARRGLRGLR